jgi:glycosidase
MKRSMPSWLKDAIFYEIYPQSFNDSNGDGIGDIQGIIRKLDYIEKLGCNAIWLNPCFMSPFQDAGYDVTDYYKVAPRYGTNADLKQLFIQIHKRNMHLILDLVPGHTSIQHPWFKESCKPEHNKFSDWYIWTNSGWRDAYPDCHSISGYADRDGQYVTNFFYSQPALNYGFAKPDPKKTWQQSYNAPGPTAVRKELKKIMRFWLDMGADGFRVDMAASLVKKDNECKYLNKLWGEIRSMLDRDYPEAMLISEWGKPNESIRAGFHADFMLHFGPPAYMSLFRRTNEKGKDLSFFSRNGKGDITEFSTYYMDIYTGTPGRGYICIPSGNHDMGRLSESKTESELKVAFAFLLTMPGMPFIYYGDEIGMKPLLHLTSKEGSLGRSRVRTPMQWTNGRNAGFSTASPRKLYLPVDADKNRPTVDAQMQSENSLLTTVRKLILLRKKYPALSNDAEFIPIFAQKNTYPFVYLRKYGKQQLIIVLNPSGKKVTAKFKLSRKGLLLPEIGSNVTIQLTGNDCVLSIGPVSYAVLKLS